MYIIYIYIHLFYIYIYISVPMCGPSSPHPTEIMRAHSALLEVERRKPSPHWKGGKVYCVDKLISHNVLIAWFRGLIGCYS